MDDIRDFYNLISPLVREEKFCVDVNESFSFIKKSHPVCGTCPQKFLAGIKREKNSFKAFIKKDYSKLHPNNSNLYLLILLFILILNSKNDKLNIKKSWT
tara:strand:- start:2419 stop:2718 length:300 start_codon:yes stop_codon:yes gene_type:complete